MDPDVAYSEAFDRTLALWQRIDACEALQHWLRKGGALPAAQHLSNRRTVIRLMGVQKQRLQMAALETEFNR